MGLAFFWDLGCVACGTVWRLLRLSNRVQAALHSGGPVGALIGYILMGSVVYCLCVSIGEMIAFL